jgi:multiple antibiotic resistance protein
MSIISAIFLLFIVLDPIGNIPCYLSVLKDVDCAKRQTIIIRESLIALVILMLFMFTGKYILQLLQVSQSSLGIAGGIVLFLIAIKMIFSSSSELFNHNSEKEEPLVVPLAVPLVAGPSSISAVILMMAREPARWIDWLIALICAWIISGVILLFSEKIGRIAGNRALIAVERLMGILLTVVSVEMIIVGIRQSFCLGGGT